MVRIESGGSSFLRRVSAKIKLWLPGKMAIIASISLQPPLNKLVRVGILLNKNIQTVPDHQPCTSSFSNVKTWGSLVPWFRSARQGTRCPFIKRETYGSHSWFLSRVGGRCLRPDTPAYGHLPTSDRMQVGKKSHSALFAFIILDNLVTFSFLRNFYIH